MSVLKGIQIFIEDRSKQIWKIRTFSFYFYPVFLPYWKTWLLLAMTILSLTKMSPFLYMGLLCLIKYLNFLLISPRFKEPLIYWHTFESVVFFVPPELIVKTKMFWNEAGLTVMSKCTFYQETFSALSKTGILTLGIYNFTLR